MPLKTMIGLDTDRVFLLNGNKLIKEEELRNVKRLSEATSKKLEL